MDLPKKITDLNPKTFQTVNFGCRVNSAETNELSALLLKKNFTKSSNNPKLFLINTCAVTQKGERQSLQKIRSLAHQYPNSKILATGCANLSCLNLKNLTILANTQKQEILKFHCPYTPQIKDKFSPSLKYILRIQSGCHQYCTYCLSAHRRPTLWHLPVNQAVKAVQKACQKGYQKLILTGINLDLYQPGLPLLLKKLLQNTKIEEISFGSLPVNCLTPKLLSVYQKDQKERGRLKNFFHVPLQSGSDKILKKMNRPYTCTQAIKNIKSFESLGKIFLGTDIIVGFPGETAKDFSQTLNLLKNLKPKKIHVFRFSPRPGTPATLLHQKNPVSPKTAQKRSQTLRNLNF